MENAERTFTNQADIVRTHIKNRLFHEARDLMFVLGGMVTMAESVFGFDTPGLTRPMRATYTQLWDELIKAEHADRRRTTMWEDAC